MFLFHKIQSVALDQILESPDLDGATVAATVTDSNGNVLYTKNGSLHIVPASNEKLFSAAFALSTLSPDYRPVTRFWREENRLVVDSVGDPGMTHQDLEKAEAALGNKDLPVFLRQSYDPEIPDEWELGDLPNRYAAPVSAFSVDQGGFELWNNRGKLELRPERYGVKIKFAKRHGKPKFSYDPIRRMISAEGEFPKHVERLDTLAVPSGSEAATSLVGRKWRPVRELPVTTPSYSITGQPLSQILAQCLQKSDNIMAENLLLMAAAHFKSLDWEHPYPEALAALKEFETKTVGISVGQLSPHDGSGLARENLVTTNAITSLLNWETLQSTSDVWKKSLASPGVGTLVSRLKGIPFQGKTGSLSKVTALSGYLVTRESKNLTISVIFNNFTCSEDRARGLIDKFIQLIFDKPL